MPDRYQVTLSHYGHEISQEGFTSFPEALARAIKLRAEWKDSRAHFVRLRGPSAEGEWDGERIIWSDGLSSEERELWP